MRHLVVIAIIVLLVKWPTSKAHDIKQCSRRSDCAPYQYCINSDCTKHKPSDYCDEDTLCDAKHHCENNKCIKYCHCTEHGEECVNGECVNAVRNAFTPAVIACLVAGAPILGCILCVIYCRCVRRTNRRDTQQQEQLQLSTLRQEANLLPDPEATGEPGVHPGGPPPYHSLERIDRETSAPPSYEEDPNQTSGRNDTIIGEQPPPSYEEAPSLHSPERADREEETRAPPSYEEAVHRSLNNLNV